MNQINDKLPKVGVTIFSVMTALANKFEAINLAQGFPDFGNDPMLVEMVCKHMLNGANQYAPMQGAASLRQAISKIVNDKYGVYYDPDLQITVTSGATEAIYSAITCLAGADTEFIVLEPCYDCYIPAIELNGGKALTVKLKYPTYEVDWDAIKDAISNKTVAIILNSPNNPTGSVLNSEDIETLADIIRETNIKIISDEVYEHIQFEGEHYGMARHPELRERSFIISSFGKSLHVTGWKVGYCIAPTEMTALFRKVHQFVNFCTIHPVQLGIADYIEENGMELFLQLKNFYREKRDYFSKRMKSTYFEEIPSKGTYFQLYSYKEISFLNDLQFCRELATKYGVAAIPVSEFYSDRHDDKVIRFCFAKQEETLSNSAKKLCQLNKI